MKRIVLTLIGVLLTGLLVAACAGAPTPTDVVEFEDCDVTEAAMMDLAEAPTVTPLQAQNITVAMLAAAPIEQDTNCIDCHSNAELLQEVAEEEEEVESLNEGSG